MASKAQMLRLLKSFGFQEARADWERYGEQAFSYWLELTDEQREALASENRLVAVWRAGEAFGAAAALDQISRVEQALLEVMRLAAEGAELGEIARETLEAGPELYKQLKMAVTAVLDEGVK